MRVWFVFTFTLKQKKTSRAPHTRPPRPPRPRPAPDIFPGTRCSRATGTPYGCCTFQSQGAAAPKVGSQGAPRSRPPGELVGLPCRAKSDRQLQPDTGPRHVAGLKIVLSRAGILGMSLQGSIWLASGRQEEANLFRVILPKILPTPRAVALGSGSPRNEKRASRSFSRPPSSCLLPMRCQRSRQMPFPVTKTPSLCLWKFLPPLGTIYATRAGLSSWIVATSWLHWSFVP